ncbi:MAG: thioredoxin family protein [Vulcanimicrobiota bacterium]
MRTFQSLCLTLILLALAGPGLADGTAYRTINADKAGERVEIAPHLVEGKLNIVDFYSFFCPPCKAIMPDLEKLAAQDSNVVVSTIDINRPGTRGIDWNSPVARQYKLRSIPYFQVYDANGELVAEGQPAKDLVMKMMQDNGIE